MGGGLLHASHNCLPACNPFPTPCEPYLLAQLFEADLNVWGSFDSAIKEQEVDVVIHTASPYPLAEVHCYPYPLYLPMCPVP